MFNGIIYNQGKILNIKKNPKYVTGSSVIEVFSKVKLKKKDIGESVCCDGVCLTLIGIKKNSFFFYLSKETLERSNFNNIKKGQYINIEKSLKYGQKVSGHYIQGHVDTTGKIKKIKIIDKAWVVSILIKKIYLKYLVEKGSISINGVSLTISKIKNDGFEITIIPHTLRLTNLIKIKKKDKVNIEFDIFSKYLLKLTK
tara:strand:- start:1057 stop:1653 length:597 start_codon:yes stop_codon:yes gene_type:complete